MVFDWLHESLLGQKKFKEAEQVKIEFDLAWQHADIKIEKSVL